MIIVRLSGGLGNQMFQYAMGRCLAYNRGNVSLKLDLSHYEPSHHRSRASRREYMLDRYKISADIANRGDFEKINLPYPPSVRFRLLRKLGMLGRSYIQESKPGIFDPSTCSLQDNICIEGCWQNESYFESISNTIRKELSLKVPLSKSAMVIKDKIQKTNAISLHVRRGDYVVLGYDLLGTDYYEAAARKVAESVQHPHFFVFSDDLPWVKKNLKIDYPTVFVDHNEKGLEHEVLDLMASCGHHIIANSSFSWWGAWLGENPRKIVISPDGYIPPPNFRGRI